MTNDRDEQPTTKLREAPDEGGSVLVALTLLTLPLVLVISTAMMTMATRNARFLNAVQRERALLAAESGFDEALYMSNINPGLKNNQVITRTLRDGMSYSAVVSFLWLDGVDNDGDGSIDEVDETVIRVVVDGKHRNVTRRIAAYLGPLTALPKMESGVFSQNPGMQIKLNPESGFTPSITGVDTNIDGSPGPDPALPGITITPPNTTADLLSELSASEQALITGSGTAPSLGVSSGALDMTALRTSVVNAANIVLSRDEYSNLKLGSAATNEYNIVYRNGDLELDGNSSGAGILWVRGELEIEDTFRWDGIIIVESSEELELDGNIIINGAVILGPTVTELELEGNSHIRYSSQAITSVNSMLPGKFIAFNGWQEISAN